MCEDFFDPDADPCPMCHRLAPRIRGLLKAWFMLALLAFSATGRASMNCPSNSFGCYDAEACSFQTDLSTAGNNLTAVGSVSCSAPPPCSSEKMYGAWDDSNNFTGPAGLRSALQTASSSQYAIEAYVYPVSLANAPVIVSANSFGLICEFTAIGMIRYYTSGGDNNSLSGTVAVNNCYLVRWQYDGTNKKIFVNGVQVMTAVADGSIASVTSISVGILDGLGGFGFNGYTDNLRFTNTAIDPTPTPTPAPVVNAAQSLYLKNSNRLELGPPRP